MVEDPYTGRVEWPPERLRCQCRDPWKAHAADGGFIWETPMARAEYGGWWHMFMGYVNAEPDSAQEEAPA